MRIKSYFIIFSLFFSAQASDVLTVKTSTFVPEGYTRLDERKEIAEEIKEPFEKYRIRGI